MDKPHNKDMSEGAIKGMKAGNSDEKGGNDPFRERQIESPTALPYPDIHIAVGPEAVDRALAEPEPLEDGTAYLAQFDDDDEAEHPERRVDVEALRKLGEEMQEEDLLCAGQVRAAADQIAELESARDTLSQCYTDADAKVAELERRVVGYKRLYRDRGIRIANLEAENELLDGEKEGLLAKVAKAWAERDGYRDCWFAGLKHMVNLRAERNKLREALNKAADAIVESNGPYGIVLDIRAALEGKP